MNEAVTKAVILAAGRGTRMGDLTLHAAKADGGSPRETGPFLHP